ncbi:MAG: DGQHR domain-containing protein [Muribaculaceae bacterium]|nr:DGQHR domain-containing protein [Muribaculaceae bacterium]
MEYTRDIKAEILSGSEEAQKWILQAPISFSYLIQDKVRFTNMEDSDYNPYAFDSDDFKILSDSSKEGLYQRHIIMDRVTKIKTFIRSSILNEKKHKQVCVLFPTALLLATESEKEIDRNNSISINDLISEDGRFFIVDGQHRLYSMKSLYEELSQKDKLSEDDRFILEYIKNYRFNCTVLLNFDLWEQARVFADVNFNQKKVDRSLYYTIYGMKYSEDEKDQRDNYIFISHNLVKFLNANPQSPLRGMVKMLGNGKGLISQAFLADCLIKHIKSPRGIWFKDSNVEKSKGAYRYMAKETVTFFYAVKDVFQELWPENGKHKSLILKTTGIGALLRLMGYIHKNNLDNEIINSITSEESNYIVQNYYNRLKQLFAPLVDQAETLFGLTSEYAGSGGRGLESKLYKAMVSLIEA